MSTSHTERELLFSTLRAANIARLPQFKNKHGSLAHSKADGSDWSPAQWLQAVVGELGEYANLRKKHERGDIDGCQFLVEAADELADVMIYLDILAFRLGIRLDVAVIDKFNRVSERVGSNVRISEGGTYTLELLTDENGGEPMSNEQTEDEFATHRTREQLVQAQMQLWGAMYYVRNHRTGINETLLNRVIQDIEKLQAQLRKKDTHESE